MTDSDWPSETPILARLMERLGTAWPHFRLTEQVDEHGRHYTLIEWGDTDTDFDPTAPTDFNSFVANRPEPDRRPELEDADE